MNISLLTICGGVVGLAGFWAGRWWRRSRKSAPGNPKPTDEQKRLLECEAGSLACAQALQTVVRSGAYLKGELLADWQRACDKLTTADAHLKEVWSNEHEDAWTACYHKCVILRSAYDVLARVCDAVEADYARERDYFAWLYEQNDPWASKFSPLSP